MLMESWGVKALNLPKVTSLYLFKMAIGRYLTDPRKYFSVIKMPTSTDIEIKEGHGDFDGEIVEKTNLSELPGLIDNLWVIVDDNGEEGLVVNILLPDEY
jgi:hypothetical protein